MIYSSRHFLTCEVYRRRNLHSSSDGDLDLSLSFSLSLFLSRCSFVRSFIFSPSLRFVSKIRFQEIYESLRSFHRVRSLDFGVTLRL